MWSIHREAPEFTEQSTEQEILATGIKVRSKNLCHAGCVGGLDSSCHAEMKVSCPAQHQICGFHCMAGDSASESGK